MARMIDAYQAIDIIDEWLDSVGTVMVGKGLSSYGELIGCIEEAPTLPQPNEWVSRLRELDELYTKLQIVTGFTAEQLLKMFAAGYTLERPDDSKSFEEMASLSETTPPNEPLTCQGCACEEYSRDAYPCNSCSRNDETLSDQYRPPDGEEET